MSKKNWTVRNRGSVRTRTSPVVRGRKGGRGMSITARFWLLPCRSVGNNDRVTGNIMVRGEGEVTIADDVVLDARAAPIEFLATKGARIEIQEGVHIGPGASIEAGESVNIGPEVELGAFTKLLDNNWHESSGERRRLVPASKPIRIGQRARIGARSILAPGAGLDDDSVLLPDSALARRVPANVTMGGVPARVMGRGGSGNPIDTPTANNAGAEHQFRLSVPDLNQSRYSTLAWLSLLEWLGRIGGSDSLNHAVDRMELGVNWLAARIQLRSATLNGRVHLHAPIALRN